MTSRLQDTWASLRPGKGENEGKKCNIGMLASYYHYYGGNAKVVDDFNQVKGTTDLFIADMSVLPELAVGPSTTTSMQTGMRAADAFIARLGN